MRPLVACIRSQDQNHCLNYQNFVAKDVLTLYKVSDNYADKIGNNVLKYKKHLNINLTAIPRLI